MTVKELIAKLMMFEPDTTVIIPDPDPNTPSPWVGISDTVQTRERFYDVEPSGTAGFKTASVVRLEGF